MKVKQLIEQLQLLDPELDVLMPGYEGGFNDVTKIVSAEYIRCYSEYDDKWYYGSHEIVDNLDIDSLPKNRTIAKGIFLK